MSRTLHAAPIRALLVAAGSVLSLASGAQAQLDDGVPSDASLFGEVINLPGDTTPAFGIALGDATGASLTQININAGSTVTTGRLYSFCEVNFFAPTDANSGSQNANFVESEVNIINGNLGLGATLGPNSTLNLTDGNITNGSNINGVANVTGGSFGNFTTIGGTLNISGNATVAAASTIADGGTINASGDCQLFGLTIDAGSTVNVSGNANLGSIGGTTIAGVVNMSGGSHTGGYTVESGGVLNLMDGVLGTSTLEVLDGGTINHEGGNLGFRTNVRSGAVVNISGGSFGGSLTTADFDVDAGGTVNFSGTEFTIDGAPIAGLTAGTAVTITDRGVLEGTLVDGSPVNFNLNTAEPDIFDAASIVTVSISSPVLLGDVNLDGVVNFQDISAFIAVLSSTGFQAEADIDGSGAVNFMDIGPFIQVLSF